MKKTYKQPAIDMDDVMVEQGIAVSPGDLYYGAEGYAGQESDYIDADGFDL